MPRRSPSLEGKLDAFARRALELLLGRVVEIVVFEAASAASRCTHPSDISTWAQSMRRATVGLGRAVSCVRFVEESERGCIQEGQKSEHGGIQKVGGKE